MTLLEIKGLKVHYYSSRGVVKAVDNVNFTLESGDVLGIVGESGCGKSTLALSVMRLISYPGRIVEGEILLHGEDILKKDERDMQDIRWKKLSIVFQGAMNALNPVHKVGDQIAEAIKLHEDVSENDASDRVEKLLNLVGIDVRRKNSFPHELSGGMKQRAMIAMALACGPEVIIADEPTTALDVISQAQILNLIKHLQADMKLSMILITHDFSVISEMSDRCAVMYAGSIVENADMKSILEKPLHPYTQALIKAFPNIDSEEMEIEPIPGSPPDLLRPPTGCRFAPRCPFAMRVCSETQPPLVLCSGHEVACWLYGEEMTAKSRRGRGSDQALTSWGEPIPM